MKWQRYSNIGGAKLYPSLASQTRPDPPCIRTNRMSTDSHQNRSRDERRWHGNNANTEKEKKVACKIKANSEGNNLRNRRKFLLFLTVGQYNKNRNSRKQEVKEWTLKQQNETADLKKHKVSKSMTAELLYTLGTARNILNTAEKLRTTILIIGKILGKFSESREGRDWKPSALENRVHVLVIHSQKTLRGRLGTGRNLWDHILLESWES